MSVQQGRIGGPLLADNLLRNGANLAFEHKVLFLDVVNKRIGFNNAAPVNELYAPNAISTTNLLVDTTADIGNFVVSGSTIQHALTSITISPSQNINPIIITPSIRTANLYLSNNTISDIVTNDSINISTKDLGGQILSVIINVDPTSIIAQTLTVIQGTATGGTVIFGVGLSGEAGTVLTAGFGYVSGAAQARDGSNNLYSITITTTALASINLANDISNVQVTVTGSLHAVGNITFDGNVTLGTSTANTISFSAELNSNLLPSATNTYNLGRSDLTWSNIYVNTYSATTLGTTASTTLTAITLNSGNVSFNSNTISNNVADTKLSTSGTGVIKFNSWPYIANNIIINPSQVGFSLNSTGNGYVQVTGNSGLAIPIGTTTGATGRPSNPVEGTTRYNTTLGYVEVYSLTVGWTPAYGTSSTATAQDVSDSATLYSIVFGY